MGRGYEEGGDHIRGEGRMLGGSIGVETISLGDEKEGGWTNTWREEKRARSGMGQPNRVVPEV